MARLGLGLVDRNRKETITVLYEVTITFINGGTVRTWERTEASAERFARRIADSAVVLAPEEASCHWVIRAWGGTSC